MHRLFASSLVALAIVAPRIAPTANAQQPEQPRTVSVAVTYADLDINTHAGARELLQRIAVASRKVCGKPQSTLMLSIPDKRAECRAAAVRQTVQALNEPTVTLAWQAETNAMIQTAAR
jgi:UrcA family protein